LSGKRRDTQLAEPAGWAPAQTPRCAGALAPATARSRRRFPSASFGRSNAPRQESTRISLTQIREPNLNLCPSGSQPGGDRTLGHAETVSDLAIAVAMQVAATRAPPHSWAEAHAVLGLAHTQATRSGQDGPYLHTPHPLAHVAQPFASRVGQCHIDCDTVQPDFGRRAWLPARPGLEGPETGLLNAVFGGCPIVQQHDEHGEEPIVGCRSPRRTSTQCPRCAGREN